MSDNTSLLGSGEFDNTFLLWISWVFDWPVENIQRPELDLRPNPFMLSCKFLEMSGPRSYVTSQTLHRRSACIDPPIWTTEWSAGGGVASYMTTHVWGDWQREAEMAATAKRLSALPRNWLVIPIHG